MSLLGYQQRQSLLLTEQQEVAVLNSVSFDTSNKGKNTPRVLMNANNGRVLNQLMSAGQKNTSLPEKVNGLAGKAARNGTANGIPDREGNSTNITGRGTPISKHTSPLASDVVHLDPIPSQKGPDSLQLLHQHLKKLNQQQRVLNADKFPPLSNDGLVLIVQAHKRENYLKQLFESLKKAKGIEKVLLVISHDYYYDDMNTMVESVDFCRVSGSGMSAPVFLSCVFDLSCYPCPVSLSCCPVHVPAMFGECYWICCGRRLWCVYI